MVNLTKWNRTDVILKVMKYRQYDILVDGSRRLATRNRRHLRSQCRRQRPKETRMMMRTKRSTRRHLSLVNLSQPPVLHHLLKPHPIHSQLSWNNLSSVQSNQQPDLSSQPDQVDQPDQPRRSSKTSRAPERLQAGGGGKSYVDAVKVNPGRGLRSRWSRRAQRGEGM